MKQVLNLGGMICLSFMLFPSCAPESETETAPVPTFDVKAEEAAIRDVMEQLVAARNAHDAVAMVALHDDVFEYSYEGKVKGRENLEKYYSESFEAMTDLRQADAEEIGIVFVTPDVAIFKGREEFTGLVDEEGKPRPPIKRYIARVVVKRDGRWLVAASFGRPIQESPST